MELPRQRLIILTMRVLLLALMIVLLPLRGWVGDAMAMATLAPAVQQAQATEMHTDHAAMAAMDTEALPCADHTASDTDPGCGHCVACDVCHSAVHTPAALAALLALAPVAPVAHAPRFPASAERAAGFKPPIS